MVNLPDTKRLRLNSEQEFFDSSLSKTTEYAFSYYTESFLSILENEAEKFFPDLQGKRLLFYGCGVNWAKAHHLVELGANVSAIDISLASIEMMKRKTRLERMQNVLAFEQMDCERLEYPDESFDVVYGRAILHHLDLGAANREVLRVLKKGGIGIFIEPLGMNPVVNLYRRLTPHLRTADEKPLDYLDINRLSQGFSRSDHKEMTLTALPAIWAQYGLCRLGISDLNLKPFYMVDDMLFRLLPWFKRLCWNVILAFRK